MLFGDEKVDRKKQKIKIISEFFPRALDQSEITVNDFFGLLKRYNLKLIEINDWGKIVRPNNALYLLKEYSIDQNYITNILCTNDDEIISEIANHFSESLSNRHYLS